MTLLRFAARSMLASYFISSGVKALRDPEALVPAAEPLIDRIVPTVRQYAPEQVRDSIPEDPVTLIRITGVLQLLGGLALATGKGRRLGSLVLAATIVPATIAKHPFWTRQTEEERSADRAHFLKNVSLLGGVLLASRDTEGRPSIAYRAQKGGQSLARDTKKASQKIADQSSDLVEGALAGGAALATAVVATSRKAKRQAAKQLKAAQVTAAKQLEESKKAAAVAAKQAQKDAAQAQKDAAKEAAKAARQAKRNKGKVAKNIKLGEN
jgi:uncharacterized membrane protein YphA (DoxX/SURF4 family)